VLFLWLVYYCKIWFSSVFICIHIPVCIDNPILRGNKLCADLMFMLSQFVSSLCWEVSHHRGLSGITSLSFWPQNQASRGPQWYNIIVFLTTKPSITRASVVLNHCLSDHKTKHHGGLSGIKSLSFWPDTFPNPGLQRSFRYIWAVQNTFCSHDLARENMMRAET
jgi:hypothetical protein